MAERLKSSAEFAGRRLRNKWVQLVLGLAFSTGFGWLAVRGAEWNAVLDAFGQFSIPSALASLSFFMLVVWLRAYRWQVIFLRSKPSVGRLFLVQNVGIGVNNLMPVRILSEATQVSILTLRYGVKSQTAVATLAVERVLDMVATAAIVTAGVALFVGMGDLLPYVTAVILLAIGTVLAVPFLIWLGTKTSLSRISFLTSLAASLTEIANARLTLAYSFLLSFLYWTGVGFSAWILAEGMGIGSSPLATTLTILAAITFGTALPLGPSGIGTFEFAVVYMLSLFDVAQEAAFSYAVILHALFFLPSIAIALTFFSFAGLTSVKQAPAVGGTERREALPPADKPETPGQLS